MGMLSTEGAIIATGTGQYALLHDCTLEFLTSMEQRHPETVKVIHVSKLPLTFDNHKVIRTAWNWENEIPQSHRKLLS